MISAATPVIDNFEATRVASAADTVLASVVSDDFAAGFIVMERSLRRHNPDWTFPLVAIHSQIKPLSPLARQVIEEHCENVHFVSTDEQAMQPVYDYATEVIGTPERLFPAFAVLEILRWSFFKRVIAIDSDVIIRGSLDPLLHTPAPFSAVRASNSETDMPMNFVNTGLMVFNEMMLRGFEFEHIRDYLGDRVPQPGTGKADQAILNILMHNTTLGYIPKRFNYTKRAVKAEMERQGRPTTDVEQIDAFLDEQDVRMLHYVGEKPWNPKVRSSEDDYAALDTVWHREASLIGEKSLFQLMDVQRRVWQSRYTESVRRAEAKKPKSTKAFERLVAQNMGL